MNLQNILTEIEKKDPEVFEKLDSRRKVMKNFARLSGKVALASVPFAFGSMFKKAYGGNTTNAVYLKRYNCTEYFRFSL